MRRAWWWLLNRLGFAQGGLLEIVTRPCASCQSWREMYEQEHEENAQLLALMCDEGITVVDGRALWVQTAPKGRQ